MNGEVQLTVILEEYQQALEKEQADLGRGSGLLGLGKKLSDAPCHAAFDKRVEALFQEAAEGSVSSEEAAEMISRLFQADKAYKWPACATWSLIAAQRHITPLIPRLAPREAEALAQWYGKRYSRFQRLPIQTNLLHALKRQAAGSV